MSKVFSSTFSSSPHFSILFPSCLMGVLKLLKLRSLNCWLENLESSWTGERSDERSVWLFEKKGTDILTTSDLISEKKKVAFWKKVSTPHKIAAKSFALCPMPIVAIIVSITCRLLRTSVCWVRRAEKWRVLHQDEENIECGAMALCCLWGNLRESLWDFWLEFLKGQTQRR